jgi:hypothetical protein
MPPPSLLTERAKVAEFYSAGSGTIPPLPWLTFPPPLSLEKAAAMANHASTRTTQLYDRRRDEVSLDEVERIVI